MTLQIFKFHKIHGRPSDNDAVFSSQYTLVVKSLKQTYPQYYICVCPQTMFSTSVGLLFSISMSRSVCEQSSCVRRTVSWTRTIQKLTSVRSFSFQTGWLLTVNKIRQSTNTEMMKLRKVHFDDGLGFSVLNCARQIWEHFKWAALKLKRTL